MPLEVSDTFTSHLFLRGQKLNTKQNKRIVASKAAWEEGGEMVGKAAKGE